MYIHLLIKAFKGHRHQLEALCNRKLKLKENKSIRMFCYKHRLEGFFYFYPYKSLT